MTALHELSARPSWSPRYRRSAQLSPVEVTRAVLDRIERWEPHLHATYALDPEAALAQAARVARRAGCTGGEPLGPLDGVPVDDQGEHRDRAATPVPLGTAATELVPAAARRAAGGARCARPAR